MIEFVLLNPLMHHRNDEGTAGDLAREALELCVQLQDPVVLDNLLNQINFCQQIVPIYTVLTDILR